MPKLRVQRLRELREQKGWSIRDLSQMLGCEVSTPARWEHGKLMPHHRSLERLAEIFNVTIEELVEETLNRPNRKVSSELP